MSTVMTWGDGTAEEPLIVHRQDHDPYRFGLTVDGHDISHAFADVVPVLSDAGPSLRLHWASPRVELTDDDRAAIAKLGLPPMDGPDTPS